MRVYDVCIRGSGAVGRSLALSLSRLGLSVALHDNPRSAPAPQGPEVRTYALSPASVTLLDSLKVWQPLLTQGAATAVHDMRVHGDAAGVLEFSAWTQCVAALAWIVDAAALDAALEQAVRFAPHVTTLPSEQSVQAELLAVCEGKASSTRDQLGVRFTRQPYGHCGVAARLVADQPHQGRAWQWFGSPEIVALLPFDRPQSGHSYGLVWSVPQARAEALLQLPEAAFAGELAQATHGAVGALTLASTRVSWPLALGQASHWTGPGWALLGDAAHQIHPLSGQGLNLGLADVSALVQVLAERESWRALGDERLLARYARQRAAATRTMVGLTDGLWHLFGVGKMPLQELRNWGLTLVNHLPPLKRWLIARALEN